MEIRHRRRSRLQAVAADFLLGIAGPALITFVCLQIGFGLARTGFAYVILIALISLLGSFSGSVVLSIFAAAFLNYFFAPPLFELRIRALDDIVRIAAFSTTSLVVSALATKLKRAEQELGESNVRLGAAQRLAAGVTSVWGDRVQLQQVVLNLILNAVEAMGSVEERQRMLSVVTEQRVADFLIAVHDLVHPEHLQRVFQPFYTTKDSGLGMGLSICRSIIDAYGGRLWADANEPRRAVLQFTLPTTHDFSFPFLSETLEWPVPGRIS